MKYLSFFILFLFIGCSQQEGFILKKKFVNSDINYVAIGNINEKSKGEIREIFEPINGVYDIYIYIHNYEGLVNPHYEEGKLITKKNVNDILLLKVYNDSIIDGYHYTLDYGEQYKAIDLYRISKKIKFKEKMIVEELDFKNVENNEHLEEIENNVKILK